MRFSSVACPLERFSVAASRDRVIIRHLSSMKLPHLLRLFALLTSVVALQAAGLPTKPNVIFILSDDLAQATSVSTARS